MGGSFLLSVRSGFLRFVLVFGEFLFVFFFGKSCEYRAHAGGVRHAVVVFTVAAVAEGGVTGNKQLVGTDTYLILIIPIITGGSVFGVFLLRGFFEGISESIFEAAKIDGAGDLRCYFNICMPLSAPILLTLAIMQLSGTWNDYIWPMIAIPSATDRLTIAAAIKKEFLSANSGSYPTLFAGYLISSIPLILLYVFSNKFYVEGLTSAAVKF